MGQVWLNDRSLFPSEQAAPARGAWFWIKQTCLLPFRLLGLILVIVLLLGGLNMWVIPDRAKQHNVDMVHLVLRILDAEGPGRPFYHLGYQKSIHAGLLDLWPDDPSVARRSTMLSDKVVSVTPPRVFGGETVIRYATGKTQKLVQTTPHSVVSPEELAAARQAVSRLFPPHDRKQWAEVLAWGESLFITSWVQKYDLKIAPRERFPGPAGGTEDEQLWCVWQVLRGGGAPEEEVFQLPELFRQSFPEKQDQESALAWANTIYERMGYTYRVRQRFYASAHGLPLGEYASFGKGVPPDTEWTRLWLLQQYVGLSPTAQAAAKQRWLSYFPTNRADQVFTLGASLAEERRDKGESLPNVPEVLPVLCVIERLTGTDGEGQACTDAISKFFELNLLSLALQFAYPNDDLYYLLASGDRLEVFPYLRGGERATGEFYLAMVIFVLVITGLATLGVQTAIQWFAARLFVRKSNRPLWEKYLAGRGKEPWYLAVVGIVLLAGIGCLTAPYSISELIAVQIGSPSQLFLGALMATACGGLLIGTFRRVAALFLVACGVDIEETWADEILGIILGALALYHFGNDLLAISLFALSDFLPALLFMGLCRLLGRSHHVSRPTKEAALCAAPATPRLPAGSIGSRAWPFDDLGG